MRGVVTLRDLLRSHKTEQSLSTKWNHACVNWGGEPVYVAPDLPSIQASASIPRTLLQAGPLRSAFKLNHLRG